MSSFASLIEQGAPPADIEAHLDALSADERIRQVRDTGAKLQKKLWELVAGAGAVSISNFVDVADQTVIYAGRNSLPLFSLFEKRFYRKAGGGLVAGYNHQSMQAFTGPGYFVTEDGANGELVFNYLKLPDYQPPGWPGLRPNKGLIPYLVYGNMIDYNRRVSSTTVIGAATKNGKPMGQYYLLTRAS